MAHLFVLDGQSLCLVCARTLVPDRVAMAERIDERWKKGGQEE